jgi:predicted MFS family arabinose efflux permease
MYYNQPLLDEMARTCHVTVRGVGLVPTLTQLGYAFGMFLIVPLGDVLPRRRLITVLLLIVAAFLALAGAARNLPWLAVASLLIGTTTVVPQILIPFAAHLTPAHERGKAIGTVMMGLLLGILLSRTLAGFVGEHWGWRAMYYIAAAMMVGLAMVLSPLLPDRDPPHKLTYAQLLRSVVRLVKTEPILRQSMLNGAMLFGGFSAFWATLIFRLEAPPLHYGVRAAGLFGLVAAAGALVAPLVGHISDRTSPRQITTAASALMIASWALFWLTGHTLWGLAVGVILLDVATQGGMVANQSRIYSLSADSHSRVNSAYMVAYFVGGALGSILATSAWSVWRWPGVCALGVTMGTVALVAHLTARRLSSVARVEAAPAHAG